MPIRRNVGNSDHGSLSRMVSHMLIVDRAVKVIEFREEKSEFLLDEDKMWSIRKS